MASDVSNYDGRIKNKLSFSQKPLGKIIKAAFSESTQKHIYLKGTF